MSNTVLRVGGLGAAVLLAGALAGCSENKEPQRDASGSITKAAVIQPFDLKAGDCYNVKEEDAVDPTASPTADDTIGSVTAVSCSTPHTGELIGVDVYPEGSGWVGLTDASKQKAFDQCDTKHFKPKMDPKKYADQSFGQYFIYPNSLLDWGTNKKVACVVETKDKKTGSVLKAA